MKILVSGANGSVDHLSQSERHTYVVVLAI